MNDSIIGTERIEGGMPFQHEGLVTEKARSPKPTPDFHPSKSPQISKKVLKERDLSNHRDKIWRK